jgi:hypothetical protein
MGSRIAAFAAPLITSILFAPTALGADGEELGRNLGELLKGWASAAFAGIAALVSLVFLLNRRYNELALFLLAAVVIGGFVFAPAAVANAIENVWLALTK